MVYVDSLFKSDLILKKPASLTELSTTIGFDDCCLTVAPAASSFLSFEYKKPSDLESGCLPLIFSFPSD